MKTVYISDGLLNTLENDTLLLDCQAVLSCELEPSSKFPHQLELSVTKNFYKSPDFINIKELWFHLATGGTICHINNEELLLYFNASGDQVSDIPHYLINGNDNKNWWTNIQADQWRKK